MKSTIEAPEFITYMGIGESQVRIDIRQNENDREIALSVLNAEEMGVKPGETVIVHRLMKDTGNH
ncbi:MAG: hypothetical protein K6E62_04615 [Lachnospiraceae bacterium]|nr:hypothetical protein [Lachnospiraceae bacterium]